MIKHIENSKSSLGEGPLYNQKEDSLYWTDIKGMKLFRYHLSSKKVEHYSFTKPIGSFAFTCRDEIIATTTAGYEYVDINNSDFVHIADPESDKPKNRFNDGKCDAKGRFLAGTMDNEEKDITGSLYSFDGENLEKLEDNLFISNGLGWNPDSTKFYLADSPKRVIYVYDYDLDSGTISNREVFAKIKEKDGYPDGLCVDSEGHIYSAHWDGWKITKYAPDGEIVKTYNLPVPRVTSCNFGGKDLDKLFITTASFGLCKTELEKAPLSGYTFVLDIDTKGQEPNIFIEN